MSFMKNTKKVKEKKSEKPAFRLTPLPTESDNLVRRLSDHILLFLEEISGFVEKYRQIPVYYIPKPEGEVVDAKIKGKYIEKIRGKDLAREKKQRNKKEDRYS